MEQQKVTKEILETLKRTRKSLGYSQSDIASATGATQPHYSDVENGNTVCTVNYLNKCCDAMGIELVFLFRGGTYKK